MKKCFHSSHVASRNVAFNMLLYLFLLLRSDSRVTWQVEKTQGLMGECVLFEILSAVKDFVNEHNIPQDDCCICMCPFDDEEPFGELSFSPP